MDKAALIQGYNNRRRRWDAVSSFAEIEALYNSTKPIKGKSNKLEYDIRPIRMRSDANRRVGKIGDNTYYLTLDYLPYLMEMAKQSGVTPERIQQYCANIAPIMWTRENGEEFVRIRNGSGDFAHTAIYEFIHTYCPKGMAFHIENGKQYVVTNEDVYPLPKSDPILNFDYTTKTLTLSENTSKYLTFKVLGDGKFERVGDTIDVVLPHVNRDVKNQYAKALDEFFGWMVYMRPFVNDGNSNYLHYSKVTEAVENLTGEKRPYYRSLTKHEFWQNKHDLTRSVLTDPEHPNRLDLAMVFYFETWHMPLNTSEQLKRLRNSFNRVANNVFGFYKVAAI